MSDTNALASVDQLFAPLKRRYKIVELPVSGATVRIQSLSEREVSSYQQKSWTKVDGKPNVNLTRMEDANRRLIVLCLVDQDGNRLLADADAPRLLEWDAADTQFLSDEVMQHVGLKDTTNLKALEKNSEKTTDAG